MNTITIKNIEDEKLPLLKDFLQDNNINYFVQFNSNWKTFKGKLDLTDTDLFRLDKQNKPL